MSSLFAPQGGPIFFTNMDYLTPAWIGNHILSNVYDEITYPFSNFNGETVEVWERISNFIIHIITDVITKTNKCQPVGNFLGIYSLYTNGKLPHGR